MVEQALRDPTNTQHLHLSLCAICCFRIVWIFVILAIIMFDLRSASVYFQCCLINVICVRFKGLFVSGMEEDLFLVAMVNRTILSESYLC